MHNDNPLDNALRKSLAGQAPQSIHNHATPAFERLATSLRARDTIRANAHAVRHPPSTRPWWWALLGIAGSAIAAATIFAFFILIVPTPTWAQIAERFRGLGFFHATVYMTENTGGSPESIELWVAQNHKFRAHYRGLIFLGADGALTTVISSKDGEVIPLEILNAQIGSLTRNGNIDPYPALALVHDIARLGEQPDLSLDRLLQLVGGGREQLQPTINTSIGITTDMQVFDLAKTTAPEWMRIWVLRKSELPSRLRLWNPRDGGQLEMLFDYANEMPENAFDPASVQAGLAGQSGLTNRLYTHMRDPGGRPLTPAQLHAAHTYALPEIDTVGRTPEGIVWVLSRNAENYRADGKRSYGWEILTDNHQQEYIRRFVGWTSGEPSMLLEYFIPLNMGAGFKEPESYTLTCTDRPSENYPPPGAGRDIVTIGAQTITQWQESATIPDLMKAQNNQVGGRIDWRLVAMDEATEHQNWSRFEQLALTIHGTPESDPLALARDIKIANKLALNGQRTAAALLCARIYPLITAKAFLKDPMQSNIVCWHIADLYQTGRHDAARQLATKHINQALRQSRATGPQFVVNLMMELHRAGLDEKDARNFFTNDITGNPAIRARLDNMHLFANQTLRPEPAGKPEAVPIPVVNNAAPPALQ